LCGVALAACSSETDNDAIYLMPPSGDYMLGGQTGSLVPDCGVAPLSAGGVAVPVGDALAVVYGRGCAEELAAEQLELRGPGARPVSLTLETLGGGAFLVRAAESLGAGQYELGVPGEAASTLSVAAEVSELPMRIGELTPVATPVNCPEDLAFELALSSEALAYVPLLRWLVSIDGEDEQLWVDYGALELQGQAGDRAVLRLPRCGRASCLADGGHRLSVRAELAGEELVSEPLAIGFDAPCAPAAGPTEATDSGSCSLGAGVRSAAPSSAAWLCCAAAVLWAARRRPY
jgi:hypothetical protein